MDTLVLPITEARRRDRNLRSPHFVQGELRAYGEFASLMGIPAADSGEMYAYGTSTLNVAAFANGLDDIYYALGVHLRSSKVSGGISSCVRV